MRQCYLLLIILLTGSMALFAQDDPWQEINILAHDFKPAPIPEKVLRREQRRIAPWIPVAGGVGILGGLALIVSERDSLPTERPLLQDDTVRVTCADDFVDVFPLRNDTGEDLRIADLMNFAETVSILNDSTVRFQLNGAPQEQTAQVVITNADGLSDISTITVISDNDVTTTARPDTFAFQATTTLRANLFANDTGPGLQLTSMTAIERDPNGRLEFNTDGSIGFTSDVQGYGGVFTYEYTVRDACGNSATATLTLLVSQSDCGFRYRIRRTDDICQGNTGQLRLQIDNPENLSFLWSDGSTEATATGLAAGDYSLTVTDQQSGCSEVLTANVPAGGGDVLTSVSTQNCGDASLTFRLGVQPLLDSFLVEIVGPGVNFEPIVLPRGDHLLSNLDSFLTPGNYVLRAAYLRAPEACASNETFTVGQVIPLPTPRVIGVTEFCDPMDGSVTIVVNEDIGRPYLVERGGFEDLVLSADTFTVALGPGMHTFIITDRFCQSAPLNVMVPTCLWGGGEVGTSTTGANRPASVEHPGKQPFSLQNSTYFTASLSGSTLQLRGVVGFGGPSNFTGASATALALDLSRSLPLPNLPKSFSAGVGVGVRFGGNYWRSGAAAHLEWRPPLAKGVHFHLSGFHPFSAPWRGRAISLSLRTPVLRYK